METDMQKSWLALRECWAEWRSDEPPSLGDEPSFGDLQQRHAQTLEALVAGGELSTDVAGKVGMAFEQMLAHIEDSMSMCYFAFPAEAFPRQDMMGQITALEAMAGNTDLDPATVAQVRAALERDIASLAQILAGEISGSEIEVRAASAEAARVLVELLLRDGG